MASSSEDDDYSKDESEFDEEHMPTDDESYDESKSLELSEQSLRSESFSEEAGIDEKDDFFDPNLERNYERVVELLKERDESLTRKAESDTEYVFKNPKLSSEALETGFKGLKSRLQEYMENFETSELAKPVNGLLDVLYTKKQESLAISRDLVIHCLNRIIKARDRILKNNALLRDKDVDDDRVVRDQGFTRPRVLILLPMRNFAVKYIQQFIQVFEQALGGQVENKKRFQDEYKLEEEDAQEQEESLAKKPEDYKELFSGNTDDCFRVGLKVTRKNLKLFSEFYQSDVIIASPLGLKMVIEGEVVKTKNKKAKRQKRKGDFDFLSSIETLVIDEADVMLMQNWEHVGFMMDHLNKIPKDPSKTDFSRVKSALLEDKGLYLRQTIALSRFQFPELKALVERQCQNLFGFVRMHLGEYPNLLKGYESQGVKVQLLTFDAPSITEEPERRLERFSSTLFPKLQKYHHVCVFVPNYFDFLRLCKFFKEQEVEYASISEYSDAGETTKARARFFNGHVRFLLVTERFHFYYRLRLRGIRKLVFYGIPEHAEYFGQWVEMLKSSDTKVGRKYELPVIVSPWDNMRLERLIGTTKAKKLYE